MFRNVLVALLVIACLALSYSSFGQRAGQSVTVRTGLVTGMTSVDLNDSSAIGGALVGGAFGAALTRSSRSSSTRRRNVAIGAVIGGAAAANSTNPGMLYTVTTNEGTMIQIATEQTEIRLDDCVFVEESGGTANIRRAAATACEPASQSIMESPAVVEDLVEDAEECVLAKDALVDAETDEEIDRARRLMSILCFD